MTSTSSIEKNSIATTPDSFKDCILALKISSQMHTNIEKRSVPQAASCNLFKNDCSVRLFSTTFVSLSVTEFLKKHVRSSSYLLQFFFKENSHSHGKFSEWLLLLQFYSIIFIMGNYFA